MKKILLIGDSIRLDYGKFLLKYIGNNIMLCGKPNEETAYQDLDKARGGNGGDSQMVLEYVNGLALKNQLEYDYFIFNCGLHDIKRKKPEEELQISPEAYENNLCVILGIMRAHGIKTIFINTTLIDQCRYTEKLSFIRYGEDVKQYNYIAEKIMTANNVPIIDLYGFTNALGLEGDMLFRDHAHFQEKAIQLQAAYIAGVINFLE